MSTQVEKQTRLRRWIYITVALVSLAGCKVFGYSIARAAQPVKMIVAPALPAIAMVVHSP